MTFIHELIFFSPSIEENFEWNNYFIATWYRSSKKNHRCMFSKSSIHAQQWWPQEVSVGKPALLHFECHCSPGWACQRGTLLCQHPGPPSCYSELCFKQNEDPFISVPSQSHPLHYFWRSTPIMIFRPYFYIYSIHKHLHSPGPHLTPPHVPHCLLACVCA